jgi:protein-S-isoprenylcysteine O-methyltransferase Ste14
MEVNPRFPGSLGLAIAAGVDFPSLYVQRAVGRPVTGPAGYRVGLRYRWLLSKGVVEAVEDPLGYLRSVASVVRNDTRCDVSPRDWRPHIVQLREAAWWLRQYLNGSPPSKAFGRIPWREGLARSRAWLCRRRSYVPFVLFSAILAAMHGFTYPRGDHRFDLAWEAVCLFLGLLGLAVRVVTVGFDAPGTAQRADASPTATGMYAVMQHPYYFGTLLMWFGIAAFPRKWWLVAPTIAAFWLYYEARIRAEEQEQRRRLGFAYPGWAAATPRLWPRLSLWKRPRTGFDLGRVLGQEHTALFGLVATLTFLEIIADLNITSHITIDPLWGGLFASTTLVYASLSILKQRLL